MKNSRMFIAAAAIGWSLAFVQTGNASLIGSEIGIFLSVPPFASFSGSTTTTVAADASDAVNIIGNFGLNFLFDPFDSGVVVTNVGQGGNFAGAQIVLSDLIWAGQPGEVVSVDFSQNNLDFINATASFTNDSATLDFHPAVGQTNWGNGQTMTINLEAVHVPEPSTFMLAALALLGLAASRRRVSRQY